jgi:proton-translocating NADH-quinone oxidoreductase chain M
MILLFIFSILIFGIFFLFFVKEVDLKILRLFSLTITGFVFFLSAYLVLNFDSNLHHFQNIFNFEIYVSNYLNILYCFGLDGISLFFFFLSSLLIFLCILFIWNDFFFKEYCIALLTIELFLLIIFSILDLFLFYVFFEAILIPMYLVIGVWGSRQRKIRAVYLFFFYTLVGSIFMLLGILYIYNVVGSLNLEYLFSWNFSRVEQMVLWFSFFFSFASKIPLFPFHIWLPEAHVEASTVGSVLLAGILLKLGVYGFLRFSLSLFPEASLFFSPLIYLFSIFGIIYASMSSIRQTDIKRIIAYSSVAHMNLVTLGLFSFNTLSIEGAVLQSISHGFVAGALFFLIGILYNRYHSRFLYYFGGLVHVMPIYSFFLLIFTLSNIALPGTSSFVGEFLLLCGIYQTNIIVSFICAIGVILCGIYSLWLYNRIIFGNLKINFVSYFSDLNFRELSIILPLFFFVILIGIYPNFFFSFFTSI